MKSQLPRLCTTLGAAFLLAGCFPDIPDTLHVDIQVTAPEQPTPQDVATARAANPCSMPLTVSMSNDQHLKLKHKVRIRPKGNGDHTFRPVPGAAAPAHQVLEKDYDVLDVSADGSVFVVQVEVQGGGHGAATPHIYDAVMEFDATSGCPNKVTLDAQPHTEESGDEDDHGGHVVLN